MNTFKAKKMQQLFPYFLITLSAFFYILSTGFITNAQENLSLHAEVISPTRVLLTWESDNADSTFQIQRATQTDSDFSTISTLSGQTGTISCYDTSVVLGKTYYYKIIKTLNDQPAVSSNVVEIIITLAKPQKLKAGITPKSQVILTWGKTEKATGYEIYRSTHHNTGYKKIGKTSKNSYTDHNVKSGHVYYYKVYAIRAKDKSVRSQASNTATAYMKPDTPSVTGFYTKNKIKLTWEKVNEADTYYIYKKNNKGKFIKIGQTSKLYYMDKSVKKGNTYQYKVAASYTKNDKTVKSKLSKSQKITASSIDPNKKMVALTYDDGPGPYTTSIVKCLKKNNGKATFFVLGNRVDSYKKELKYASDAGCEIANHSYDHSNLTRLSAKEIKNQINMTDQKIKKITGKSTKFLRTPGGATNNTVTNVAGKPIILWSIDTLDWKTRNCDKTVNSVLNNVKDGDIILMHDIHKPTKDASLIIIPKLRKMGYQLVTVSELAQIYISSYHYRTVYLGRGNRTLHHY